MNDNPLALRIAAFMDLSTAEHQELDMWVRAPTSIRARRPFTRQGDWLDHVSIMLEGWAYRYIDTREGKRQIIGILLPGDMCGAGALIGGRSDHYIAAFSPALIATVSRNTLQQSLALRPRLKDALSWSSLVEEGTARHWLANIGQRGAAERIAHLFCELWLRAAAVKMTSNNRLTLPLTQADLGDALGLTSVHTNRKLRSLREAGLLRHADGALVMLDYAGLAKFAGFDPSYLQMRRDPELRRRITEMVDALPAV